MILEGIKIYTTKAAKMPGETKHLFHHPTYRLNILNLSQNSSFAGKKGMICDRNR